MRIPAGVIFIWTGTNATIPAGWQRETSLDNYFIKGADFGYNPNQTGGSTTHSHSTSASHSHNDSGHTHTITVGGITTMAGRKGDYASQDVLQNHTHGSHASGAVSGGGLTSVSSTYSSISNNPPYYEVIFIKPITGDNGLPVNVVALLGDTSFVNNTGKYYGFYKCDGNNSTPNLHNKYLKGASAGSNAGSTGGSTTNIHNLTHTHSVNNHSHVSATSAVNSEVFHYVDGWGGVDSGLHNANHVLSHSHNTSLNNNVDTVSSSTITLTTSETVEPEYKKLLTIQNKNTSKMCALGIIGIWLGNLTTIPVGWTIYSMQNKYLKATITTGEIDNSGGSNSHAHASQSHTHTSSGHTHGYTTNGHPAWQRFDGSPFYTTSIGTTPDSLHTCTVSTNTTTYSNASTSANISSNEPQFKTVIFIKLIQISRGGGAWI